MNRLLALLSAVVLCSATSASADPVEPHVTTVPAPGGCYTLTWPGTANHTYFIETSLDAVTWNYAPVIEFGTGDHVWGFDCTYQRIFVRLRYTDAPVPGGNPDFADFDGDGISNIDELTIHGTDPFFNGDTDGDGLTDGQEIAGGTNPLHFDMPQIRVMASWRDASIEDWREDVSGSPNNYQWPTYSVRAVKAQSMNTTGQTRFDWPASYRTTILSQIPNIYPADATRKLWNDAAPAPAPGPVPWGTPVETGTTLGAWMLQTFSREEPYKVHTIRAKGVKVFLQASRPMPIEFRAVFKVRVSTRSGDGSAAFGAATQVNTYPLTIQRLASQSSTFEVNPAETEPPYPPAIGINQPHTVSDAYYSIVAEAYPFASAPLPPPVVDTDMDGLPDPQELSIGSDPNSADTDGDGRTDLFDFLPPLPSFTAATTAGSGSALESEPPYPEYIFRDGHICPTNHFTTLNPPNNARVLVRGEHWRHGFKQDPVATPSATPITTIQLFWDVNTAMALTFPSGDMPPALPYYGTPYGTVAMGGIPGYRFGAIYPLRSYSSVTNYQYSNPTQTALGGEASEVMVRLRRSAATAEPVSRTFMLIDRQKTDTTMTQWTTNSVTMVTMSIEANDTTSPVMTANGGLFVPAAVQPAANKISMHERCLFPIEVTIRRKTETYTPPTGLCVKKAEVITFDFNGPAPASDYPLAASTLKWQIRQIRRDGTFTSWTFIPGEGCELDYNTPTGGIFQAKAILTPPGQAAQEFEYLRKKDAGHPDNSEGSIQDLHRSGAPDYFGVVDSTKQNQIRDRAVANLGNGYWDEATPCEIYSGESAGANTPKCNIFVYHVCNSVGATVPLIESRSFNPFADDVPPNAIDWWNDNSGRTDKAGTVIVTYNIPGWASVPDAEMPQPGWMVARPKANDNPPHYDAGAPWTYSSHVGILDYDGSWVNAGKLKVNKYCHLTTGFYQPARFKKYSAP